MSTKPTIKDIAKICGVSTVTVSRVISNSQSVKSDTRDLILRTMQELNYRPEKLVKFKSSNRREHVISLISDSVTRPERIEIIHAIEAQLIDKGYLLVLCETGEDPARQEEYLRYVFNDDKISGIIVISGLIDQAKLSPNLYINKHKPLVSINWSSTWSMTDAVVPDVFRSVIMAVDYLKKNGHHNIAFLGSPSLATGGMEGRLAFISALTTAGLPLNDEKYIYEGDMKKSSGIKVAREIASVFPEVQGIVCSNLSMAAGFTSEMEKIDKTMADNISVIVSGISMSKEPGYSFASTGPYYEEAGAESVSILMERIRELETTGQLSPNMKKIILVPHLYEGSTVHKLV